jgi:type I restriction enzyme M protein
MLDDIKKTLWAAADKLRANMDAAEYKHIVLGLIFLKYISDTFAARREELILRFADEADEYFLHECDEEMLAEELEDRDYYKEANVFWVPEEARWENLRNAAKQPDIGKRIDEALSVIEAENPKLKGILDKRYARAQLPDGKLGELVDLISTIGFADQAGQARDVLGQVFEYFLGQFASAEGKKGGQFYTPASIVKLLVAVLGPHHGKVYDPCCGSAGMFVQSERFIESHGGKLGDISIYGQESNPTTWRLAAMNLAIRGIDYNLGREPGDSFTKDQHPDLRANFILANPPFNISDWWHGSLEGDPRWVYGTPPTGNANYAWLQHMLYHLAPDGRAGIVLANGSMGSTQSGEGDIRRTMVEADKVEVMIALPGQLFFNTPIPACLWFLTKQKTHRKGEVLFIDARKLGSMISRVQAELTDEVIARIATTVAKWRNASPLPQGEGSGVRVNQAPSPHKPPLPENLLAFARELRQNPTDVESWLWQSLRDRRLAGHKFRRQHPVQPYVLDFYCHELKLGVELDGAQHNTDPGRAKDQRRSDVLAAQGIQILRFWNNDVLQQPEAVLEAIFAAVTELAPSPPTPLPEGKGGEYRDIPGYCRSVPLTEIAEHGHVLTPGRYVGAEEVEDDDEAFTEKMTRLTEQLGEKLAKGAELDQLIRQKLGRLGYEF